jgi:hypothetical protein
MQLSSGLGEDGRDIQLHPEASYQAGTLSQSDPGKREFVLRSSSFVLRDLSNAIK